MTEPDVRLLVSDIDGTMVRHDKSLPDENIAAVREVLDRGIPVSLISARPAAGILPIAEALGLNGPFGAFNGGTIFDRSGVTRIDSAMPEDVTRRLIELYSGFGVTIWFFTADRWLATDASDPHTPREVQSSGLQPDGWDDIASLIPAAHKVVAVCDDPDTMDRIEDAARPIAGDAVTLVRSQDYYLDATALAANKGDGIAELARLFGVDLAHVAVLGDQANDIAMFRRAGLSVAMGQAGQKVKDAATHVAAPNGEGGVSDAIRRYILPRLP